jgi:hypothetical protein
LFSHNGTEPLREVGSPDVPQLLGRGIGADLPPDAAHISFPDSRIQGANQVLVVSILEYSKVEMLMVPELVLFQCTEIFARPLFRPSYRQNRRIQTS